MNWTELTISTTKEGIEPFVWIVDPVRHQWIHL